MLACKGIFARPSIPQASEANGRESAHSLQKSREFCGYYTTSAAGNKEILTWVGTGGISGGRKKGKPRARFPFFGGRDFIQRHIISKRTPETTFIDNAHFA